MSSQYGMGNFYQKRNENIQQAEEERRASELKFMMMFFGTVCLGVLGIAGFVWKVNSSVGISQSVRSQASSLATPAPSAPRLDSIQSE